MQIKSEVNTNYSTWRDEYITKLEANSTGRHGFQNGFYGKLLIETFEKKHPELLPLIKVNEQFIKLIQKYTDELRRAYAYEWDKAKSEASDNKLILDFTNELHTQGFLSKEIKKVAPPLTQENRSTALGLFKSLPNKIENHLKPQLNFAEAHEKMDEELAELIFSFNKDEIGFTSTEGAHVSLTSYEPFKKWFDSLPIRKSQQLNATYQAYKVNSNTIAINQGLNTPGIRIVRNGEGFQVVSNLTANATPSNTAKEKNLITTLDALKSALQTLCKQVKEEVKNDKQKENCLIQ
ncbi:Uncharacterised protein [Legionella beliardensis]|uniref:Uncharacterized protein n=1 Tax=Legionella beliardensis TaxID=91822 RepID=A0A378ID31_9GAMM|nr:hypothetical protein [Legionella beliardensis]STX30204.1 Uncharacterised protein [Legionella beliardensis]